MTEKALFRSRSICLTDVIPSLLHRFVVRRRPMSMAAFADAKTDKDSKIRGVTRVTGLRPLPSQLAAPQKPTEFKEVPFRYGSLPRLFKLYVPRTSTRPMIDTSQYDSTLRGNQKLMLESFTAAKHNPHYHEGGTIAQMYDWKLGHDRLTSVVRSASDGGVHNYFLGLCKTYMKNPIKFWPTSAEPFDKINTLDWSDEACNVCNWYVTVNRTVFYTENEELEKLIYVGINALLDAHEADRRLHSIIYGDVAKVDKPASCSLLERYLNVKSQLHNCEPYVYILHPSFETTRVFQKNDATATMLALVNKALVLQRDLLPPVESWPIRNQITPNESSHSPHTVAKSANYITLLTGLPSRFDPKEVSKAVAKTVELHNEWIREAVHIYDNIMLDLDDKLTRDVATTLLEFLTPYHPLFRKCG